MADPNQPTGPHPIGPNLEGYWVEDRKASDAAIETAPPAIRALFREYDENHVLAALVAAGINDHPSVFTQEQLDFGIEIAEGLLKAERRRRQQDLIDGKS